MVAQGGVRGPSDASTSAMIKKERSKVARVLENNFVDSAANNSLDFRNSFQENTRDS